MQVSRLGNPLVNEVVIGIRDKDRFNSSEPVQDPQFLKYVTHPALPELLEALFGGLGVRAPNNFPRNDLVATFLTGIPGLTKPAVLTAPGEMLRLNTSIAPTVREMQSNLAVLAGDAAGFPNGRRPGDDVVDIELRAAMGVLCTLNQPATFGCVPADAPTGNLPYTDGATVSATDFDAAFPYLADADPRLAEQLRRAKENDDDAQLRLSCCFCPPRCCSRVATATPGAMGDCGLGGRRRACGSRGSRRSGGPGRFAGTPGETDLAAFVRSGMDDPEYIAAARGERPELRGHRANPRRVR